MTIVRVGATKNYVEGWDAAFGRGKAKKVATPAKKAATSAKTAAAPAKKTATAKKAGAAKKAVKKTARKAVKKQS